MNMKLENQLTSLELSKRLKKLGIPQESIFKWVGKEIWDETMQSDYEERGTTPRNKWLAAYSVAELGEMLKHKKINCWYNSQKQKWGIYFYKSVYSSMADRWEFADTEAEARGLMLEYLITNKLMSV